MGTRRDSTTAKQLVADAGKRGYTITGRQIEEWSKRFPPSVTLSHNETVAYYCELSTLIRPRADNTGVLVLMAFRGHEVDEDAFRGDMVKLLPSSKTARTGSDADVDRDVSATIAATRERDHPERAHMIAALGKPDTEQFLTTAELMARGDTFQDADHILVSFVKAKGLELTPSDPLRGILPTTPEIYRYAPDFSDWTYAGIRDSIYNSPIADIVEAARILFPFCILLSITVPSDTTAYEIKAMIGGAVALNYIPQTKWRKIKDVSNLLPVSPGHDNAT